MKTKEYGNLVQLIIKAKETLITSRKSDVFFTRRSILSFATIVTFLLDMQKTALQARGNNFLRHQACGMRVHVTKQAISKRRNEFDHTPFVKIMQELVKKEYSGEYKTAEWYNHTILAVDGSKFQLPCDDKLMSEFGDGGSGVYPMAGVSVLYDVLHGWPLDATITHSHMNERKECIDHIEYLCETLPDIAKKAIFTLDRGYPSLEMYEYLQSKNIKFVAKCKKESLAEINKAPIGDTIITSDISQLA